MKQGYKIINIESSSLKESYSSILIIYTGGTIGMDIDTKTKNLVPLDFERIMEKVPELKRFDFKLTVFSLVELIDSSDMNPDHWIYLAQLIRNFYNDYNGFVILHGTDTMAYTASALSFLLFKLNKPVILTGAQLPIVRSRTDARENLISALDIASASRNGKSIINEVCIYFDHLLLRGNRSSKIQNIDFTAFTSENYPPLAKTGIYIKYNMPYIQNPSKKLKVYTKMDSNVCIIKLFPGISVDYIAAVLNISNLKAVILETFGSGNFPSNPIFLNLLKEAINKGVFILNVSQSGGSIEQNIYPNGKQLADIGVISGRDITTEAAITKMMFLLGNFKNRQKIKNKLQIAISGEIIVSDF